MAEEWISLRAYARHRGVALSAVQKAIETKRVNVVRRNERQHVIAIEKHAADQQWAANTDPAEAARNGKFIQTPATTPSPSASDPAASSQPDPVTPGGDKPADGQDDEFRAARIREAQLRGDTLELDKLKRIGELMPRAIVRQVFSEIFAQLKNAVMRVPDRKAQALAGETDPTRIQRLLADELRTVFDEFSGQLLAPTAGMADDAGLDRGGETPLQ